MCTVILLRRPGESWPLLLAANRDERTDRAWDAPGRHWPEHRYVIGGRDREAGGTWMAVNRAGVVAAVLNRPGSLGPAPGKRSRGELPLMALAGRTAREAAELIEALDASAWRPFNMVIADAWHAFFLRGEGGATVESIALPEGVSMVTAHDPNDMTSPRIARHLPRFRDAPTPDPSTGDWASWETLLGDDGYGPDIGRAEALHVPAEGGFGTVSSSLLGAAAGGALLWRFAAGPAGGAPYETVAFPWAMAPAASG